VALEVLRRALPRVSGLALLNTAYTRCAMENRKAADACCGWLMNRVCGRSRTNACRDAGERSGSHRAADRPLDGDDRALHPASYADRSNALLNRRMRCGAAHIDVPTLLLSGSQIPGRRFTA